MYEQYFAETKKISKKYLSKEEIFIFIFSYEYLCLYKTEILLKNI